MPAKTVEEQLAIILSEALNIPRQRAEKLLESKATRILRYKNIRYIVIRRDIAGHYEGTTILLDEQGGYRLIEGYPHIKRILLLKKALETHFIDKIVVEEKMDGHNTRIVRFNGELYAITRGGYICPYTTMRFKRKYGEKANTVFDELGEDTVIAGEVVGLENPYTRVYYPEAPDWDYFVFDVFTGGLNPLDVEKRRALVEDAGLRSVPLLGVIDREDYEELRRILEKLERLGREGVVLKDPYYRVEPLKYTTSYINVKDIEDGMRFPFDEGHTFIFPRLLRQMFKAYEESWDEQRIEEEALRLGRALLVPALESIRKYSMGEMLGEVFELTFYSWEDLEDFVSHEAMLGVPLTILGVQEYPGILRARILKHKHTPEHYRRIFRTGLSPLD